MTIRRFLTYTKYSDQTPNDVHPARWKAMLHYYASHGLQLVLDVHG